MKHICLFDIDGTLLSSGGAGKAAMQEAFCESFRIQGIFEGLQTAGRTDRAITKDLFDYHEHEMSDENFDLFFTTYKKKLPVHLSQSEGSILPGVKKLIEALHAREDVDLGLLTGNYAEGAELKLSHFGMFDYFEFGGFGDNHLERDEVAREALRVITDRHVEFTPERIWVIGDTPADVQCGRAIGAKVIAVATGIFSYEELEKTEPDYLYHDFSDTDQFISILDNHSAD